jgi:hypothetical protein
MRKRMGAVVVDDDVEVVEGEPVADPRDRRRDG